MAIPFEGDRIVPVWLKAAKHLATNGRTGRNLILEIADPGKLTADDRATIALVDKALRDYCDLSVKTVAATIFPQAMYQRYGRPDFYKEFTDKMAYGKKKGTWGTYALRIFERRAMDPTKTINPVEQIITKLVKATTDGKPFQSNYELGVVEPSEDLDPEVEFGCELPTFNVARDGRCVSNLPCLSHLSFKLTDHTQVDLTAIYRSHYYCERALGNLIGLSQLLQFVATESNLTPGTLTCISTHAVLDLKPSWGPSINQAQALLAQLS